MNISLFWSSNLRKDSETFNHWRHRRISLSTFHEATLLSHVKAGNTVRLYTYQNFDESVPIPPEISVEDGHQYFPAEDAFSALKRGHSIAHISDVVRLRSAIEHEAVVMDIDNIILRPFPEIDTFTSTMAAKTTGAMAIQFKDNHPPFRIKDGSWDGKALSVFPMKVHNSIVEDVEELCSKIESSLSKPPTKGTKGWNYVMWTLKDIANRYDNVHVMKPIDTTPFPAWKSAGKCYSLDAPTKLDGITNVYGYVLPSIDQILQESYCVQHFFESAFKNADRLTNDFWQGIKVGSLLYEELNLVLGQDWIDKKCHTNLYQMWSQ